MKLINRRCVAFGIFLVLACSSFVWAQQKSVKLEGAKPYTPSRLEWLAVELNAGSRVPLSVENGYSMDFVPLENENTILIFVKYLPSVNREIMNMDINTSREIIAMESKARGWSSWLRVKERVEMAKTKQRDEKP